MRTHFALFAAAAFIAAGCGAKPKVNVVGTWEIESATTETAANQPDVRIRVNKDGTYVITGGIQFQAMIGAREIRGTYRFTGDYDVHVEMERNPFGFEPTDFTIRQLSRKELVFNTEEYAITLRRAE